MVIEINDVIEQFKNKLRVEPEEEQKKLDLLLNTKNRYLTETAGLIENWQKYHEKKDKLSEEKDENKGKLNSITHDILSKYSEGINKYLYNCGANFELYNSEVK